jgi:hypothetical protein
VEVGATLRGPLLGLQQELREKYDLALRASVIREAIEGPGDELLGLGVVA